VNFRGNVPAKIDSQGRLKIPSDHKAILDDIYGSGNLYITSVKGDSIVVYPLKEWQVIEAKLRDTPASPAKRRFQRNTAYWGKLATIDSQDRVLLPAQVRTDVGVDDGTEVAVIGKGTYLELWDREKLKADINNDPVTDDDMTALGINM